MNDTHTTNPFSADLAEARANWATAQAQLKATRKAYKAGASVRLAEILAAQETLRQKTAAANTAKADAEAEFKRAFEAAGFEKTPAVQKALNQRNDEMAVAEELQAALARLGTEYEPVFMQATEEAGAYKQAHTNACHAYGRMHAFEVLEKHGPPLIEAMAMLAHVPTTKPGIEIEGGPGAFTDVTAGQWITKERKRVLLEELEKHASIVQASRDSFEPIIGALELGPLAGRLQQMSPAKIHAWRVERAKESSREKTKPNAVDANYPSVKAH